MKTNNVEFNPFLKALLILISTFSLIISFNDALNNVSDFGNSFNAWIPFIFTIINAFAVLYLILKIKSISGILLFYLSEILNSILLLFVFNNEFRVILVTTIPRILFISLLLFIPYNGNTAWSIIIKNKTNIKKFTFLAFALLLFSCSANKLKNTAWTCTVPDDYNEQRNYKIEFLTADKCVIGWTDKFNNQNTFCVYKFENSNLVLYFDMPNGNRIIYDIGTIENNNCIKFRKIANGNCFAKNNK